MTEMLRVRTPADIDSVAALARDIWIKHYVPIIGQAQTDYMLAMFQSTSAIARQIAEGYQYYIVMTDGVQGGYFAVVPDPSEHRMLLSKIYVNPKRHGTGLGKAILVFIEERCVEMGVQELWLTVNRHNIGSIGFYQHLGFTLSEPVVQDIGNGFVMDDYKMVKTIHGLKRNRVP
jgi:GNAT superfamily N-acetyltransferase